jgi:hypothetical protein
MLSCEGVDDPLTTVPLPDSVLPPATATLKKQQREKKEAGSAKKQAVKEGCFAAICNFARGFCAPLVTKYDSDLSINAPLKDKSPYLKYSDKRIYGRFPPVPLSDLDPVRKKFGCSMNDAVMAAITGALRKYAMEKGDKSLDSGAKVECKSLVMIGLPRAIDAKDATSAVCNNILFATMPLPVDEATPAGRMKRTIAGCNNLKTKSYMSGLVGLNTCLTGICCRAVLNKAAAETWSKHTLQVSNVPGPGVATTWPKGEGGKRIDEVQLVVANVMPQISLVSYDGVIYSGLVTDPELIGDVDRVGQLFKEEFSILAQDN